jgi:hypothetical protein
MAGFEWGKLSDGSVVVDVGGGIGNQCATLVEHYPQLSFVVQDQAPIIREGVEVYLPFFSVSSTGLIDTPSSFGTINFPVTSNLGRFYLKV